MKRNSFIRDQYFPFILFLFSPLLTLFIALKEYKSNWAKNVLWLFVVFFAFSMSKIFDEWDISRYIQQFKDFNSRDVTFSIFWEDIINNNPDFLQSLINYLVSRITGNTQVILAVYGMVYGYFFSRNIFFMLDFLRDKITIKIGLIVFAVSFIVSIMDFNGFRYWTATHMFIYGIVNFYLLGKKRYGLFWILLTFTMHFSFTLNIIVFIIHELFLKKRVLLGIVMYLVTLNMGSIGIDKLIPKDLMPKTYEQKASTYANEDNMAAVKETESSYTVNSYVAWPRTLLNYLTWAIILTILFKLIYRRIELPNSEMLSMVFWFGSVANLAATNSISGARFISIFSILFFIYAFFIYDNLIEEYYFNVFVEYYSWVFVVSAIVNIRRVFDVLGFSALLGGPVIRAWMPEDIPIIDAFKAFFPSF